MMVDTVHDATLRAAGRPPPFDPRLVNGQGSFNQAMQGAWHELRSLLREHAVLGVLEAQRAGLHLAYALAAVLIVSVLGVTAWLAIVTAVITWLARSDVPWPLVFLLAAVLNVVAAAIVAWWVKRQFTELPFAASLRQLSADRHDINMGPSHAQAPRP